MPSFADKRAKNLPGSSAKCTFNQESRLRWVYFYDLDWEWPLWSYKPTRQRIPISDLADDTAMSISSPAISSATRCLYRWMQSMKWIPVAVKRTSGACPWSPVALQDSGPPEPFPQPWRVFKSVHHMNILRHILTWYCVWVSQGINTEEWGLLRVLFTNSYYYFKHSRANVLTCPWHNLLFPIISFLVRRKTGRWEGLISYATQEHG